MPDERSPDDGTETPIDQRFRILGKLTPYLRWRYPLLVAVAFASSLQHMRGTGEDWHYFVLGSELLFGQHHLYSPLAGGLHLYANYPQLQIGPLSFLVATPFRVFDDTTGRIVAALVMTALAPLLVFLLEKTARKVWAPGRQSETLLGLTVALGGVMVMQAWAPLATIYAHLDDVLVLTAITIAVWAVAHERPLIVGLVIGLGIASKPWAVVALPLILALPGWGRLRALGLASAISAACWLPFVIADPATLDAIKPAVVTAEASVLHLLGVERGDAPGWVRPVQLGTALLVGCIAVARRRWAAVALVGIAVRIALDPQVFLYYSAGLILAALAWDLLRSPLPVPAWTLATFVLLNVAYVSGLSPGTRATLRLLITVAIVGSAMLLPAGRPGNRAPQETRANATEANSTPPASSTKR